ncbi:MAG: thioredoxin family protein [Alphaproteobacteria bacterium]|nr:thioredoxin family protein [Alphaproteobacteria bacterium]
MSLIYTPEKDESFYAPDFSLKNIDGRFVSFADIRGEKGTLVMFICNHCPYVRGITDRLAKTMKLLQDMNIGVVAIMANDIDNYSEDSFENMKIFAQENNFTFPYLIDETQETARAYGAVCTPDFFGFNKDNQLQYRGRLDSSGKDIADNNTKPELLEAMTLIAKTGIGSVKQTPSVGCSIKWR